MAMHCLMLVEHAPEKDRRLCLCVPYQRVLCRVIEVHCNKVLRKNQVWHVFASNRSCVRSKSENTRGSPSKWLFSLAIITYATSFMGIRTRRHCADVDGLLCVIWSRRSDIRATVGLFNPSVDDEDGNTSFAIMSMWRLSRSPCQHALV